jgi:hypothetical protein
MVTRISSLSSAFRVPRRHYEAALPANKALGRTEDESRDAFLRTSRFANAAAIFDAMAAWRWDLVEERGSGDGCDPIFTGVELGDGDVLFSAIARYIEPGSHIEVFCLGEGSVGRWVFAEAVVRLEEADVVFGEA